MAPMSTLTDERIERLASPECPHAYSHEVKAMAEEIRGWRSRANAPAAPNAPGLPFGAGTYP